MQIHLRIMNENEYHTRFTVLVNGECTGALTMSRKRHDFDWFLNALTRAVPDVFEEVRFTDSTGKRPFRLWTAETQGKDGRQ